MAGSHPYSTARKRASTAWPATPYPLEQAMAKRMVILLSGGIESLVTAALAVDMHPEWRHHALYVNYGHVAADAEQRAARAIAREYALQLEEVELTLPFLEAHDFFTDGIIIANEEMSKPVRPNSVADRAHVVPMRNLALVSLAAMFAGSIGASEVWAGFDDNPASPTRTKDKSPEFVDALRATIKAGSDDEASAPTIVTPLQGNSKAQTIETGERLGVRWSISWSCYNGFGLPCGVCAQCRTRRSTFALLNIDEGVEYCSREFIDAQGNS